LAKLVRHNARAEDVQALGDLISKIQRMAESMDVSQPKKKAKKQ
jgi:hypothetical protein